MVQFYFFMQRLWHAGSFHAFSHSINNAMWRLDRISWRPRLAGCCEMICCFDTGLNWRCDAVPRQHILIFRAEVSVWLAILSAAEFSVHVTYMWPWLGPRLTTVQYVMYFRFCGWRHIFTQWRPWTRIKHYVFLSSSAGGGTSRTSDEVIFWLS